MRRKKGGENSYEFEMKKVLEDMRARPSVRAGKDWDLTEKIAKAGREIVEEMVKTGEITKEYGRKTKLHILLLAENNDLQHNE